MFSICYMPGDKEYKGFDTEETAAIYAYHHCMCNLCKGVINKVKERGVDSMLDEYYLENHCSLTAYNDAKREWENISKHKNDLVWLWFNSSCSAEWWICEDEEEQIS